mmetsp:Transcript_17444/g.36226  ORF Transcript_17444/g.36226 Transcript_17444/m.36226 type:complete len:116 (-) Transcript_17444:172-519(-)
MAFVTSSGWSDLGFLGKNTVVSRRHAATSLWPRSRAQSTPRVRRGERMSILPLVPDLITLPVYAYLAIRFYQGFDRTTYNSSYRLPLSLIWPVLLINGRSRENLQRALKASDDDY